MRPRGGASRISATLLISCLRGGKAEGCLGGGKGGRGRSSQGLKYRSVFTKIDKIDLDQYQQFFINRVVI
jgi:hypothetical protein